MWGMGILNPEGPSRLLLVVLKNGSFKSEHVRPGSHQKAGPPEYQYAVGTSPIP